MIILNARLYFLAIFIVNWSRAELNPAGENVCIRTEIYNQTIMIEKFIPVTVTEKHFCFSIAKRFLCDKNKTEFKKVKEPQVIDRTRLVVECCAGYEEDNTEGPKCVPVCPNECIHGECIAPETCECESGFFGANCQTPCHSGYWGRNCKEQCECLNDAECGKVNGNCTCKPGWQGSRCEFSCAKGYYGFMCNEKCTCNGQPCDPTTGECSTTTKMSTETEKEYLYVTTPMEKVAKPISVTDVFLEETIIISTTEKTIWTEETISTNKAQKISTTEVTPAVKIETEIITSIKTETEVASTTEAISVGETSTKEMIFATKNYHSINNKIDTSESWETVDVTLPSSFDENELILSKSDSTENTDISAALNTSKINEKSEDSAIENVNNILVEKEPEDTVSDNSNELNSHNNDFRAFRFLPSLIVLSGTLILIFIIAARSLALRRRKKANKISKEKETIIVPSEGGRKNWRETIFIVNNSTENPVYLSDMDANKVVPILKTFKPLNSEIGTGMKVNGNHMS